MDCYRRGCPLNKSTNKNANVNIFSPNFFPSWMENENFTLYWQSTEGTINNPHCKWERWFHHACFFFFHLYEESLESSKCLQRTEENISLLTWTTQSSCVSLTKPWNPGKTGRAFSTSLQCLQKLAGRKNKKLPPLLRVCMHWNTVHNRCFFQTVK